MGFTSETTYTIGYVEAKDPYICLGQSPIRVDRNRAFPPNNASVNKYQLNASFDVFYSLSERNLDKPVIDRINVFESVSEIPANLSEWAYSKVKADSFDGQKLTDC